MNVLSQILILTLRFGRRSLGQTTHRLLAVCIILCSCVAASLSLFSSSVQSALEQDISHFLGAPLVVRSSQPILNAIPSMHDLHAPVSTQTLTTGAIANRVHQSVSLKGVSAGYPLRGEVIIKRDNKEMSARGEWLGMNEAWLDRRTLDNLKLGIGEQFQIGESVLTVVGEVLAEPDRLTQLQHTLPRIMVSERTLAQTGVLVDNERVEYRVLLSGSDDALISLEKQLPTLTEHQYDVLKPSAGYHPFARLTQRAERMQNLIVVLMLLMCGGAAAMLADYAMGYYKTPTAILRCMGLRLRVVTSALCLQLLVLTLVTGVIGALCAWLVHPKLISLLHPYLQLSVAPFSFKELGVPVGVGLLMVSAFVIPSLQRLTSMSVAEVLRGEASPQKRVYLTLVCAVGLVTVMLWLSSDNPSLTMMLVFAVGILVLLAVVFGWGLSQLSAQLHHLFRGPLKIAVRAIGRSPRRHITPLVSVGITMMALLMTVTLRGSFIDTLQVQRLEADGNFIFTGLPAHKKSQFMERVNDQRIELKGIYPTIRATLVEINGLSMDEALKTESDTREQIRSKVRLSWAARKPENNTLVEGKWPALGTGEVSVEQEVMSDLGLNIGDELGFRIGDRVVKTKITSTRKYNGQSSSMMFWFMFAPDALSDYDYGYMGGLLLKNDPSVGLSVLAKEFPQLQITNLERQMSRIRDVMTAITRLMNMTLWLLLCGASLLILTSSYVGSTQQKKQLALLRTFGLRKKQAYIMAIMQQLVLGCVACTMGIVAVQAIAGLMFQNMFNLDYMLNWPLALGLSAAIIMAYVTIVCISTSHSLRQTLHLSFR